MALTPSLGKNGYVSLNAVDLSTYVRSTSYEQSYDTYEVTTYGKTRKCYVGGLGDGTVTLEGVYSTAASSPRSTIVPLLGTTVAFVYRPAGTGSGKDQDTVNVVVMTYNESVPVDDVVQFTVELQMTDTVTVTGQ